MPGVRRPLPRPVQLPEPEHVIQRAGQVLITVCKSAQELEQQMHDAGYHIDPYRGEMVKR